MSHQTKAAALALLLTLATSLHANVEPDLTGMHVRYHGFKAERLFYNLSESLLLETRRFDDREERQKIGRALGCTETTFLATQTVEFSCVQYFFSDGLTANEALISIPFASSGQEGTYSELKLTGDVAAQLFSLAAVTFPEEVEFCTRRRGCDYQRIVKARDITCFERAGADASLQYDCAQYIQNLDGSAVPGGGDPMIGVVL